MQKRGQFHISFGMIFSVIIIIAILGIAFYVIANFISIGDCTKIGLFYENLQDHIDDAWRSTIHREEFSGELSSGIEYVCFGDLKQSPDKASREMQEYLSRRFQNKEKHNVFLYPPRKACDNTIASLELEHVEFTSFFCIQVKNGKIGIITEKDQFDSFVSIREI